MVDSGTTVDSGTSALPGWTVGSLAGVAQGSAPKPASRGFSLDGAREAPPESLEGEDWTFLEGRVYEGARKRTYETNGLESLTYSNPFRQGMERVWFDGKVVYACELGELDVDPSVVKVAQEYQVVYAVDLDDQGKLRGEPERVPGQYNLYDSVPGMENYSPIWQFNYVVVPRDFQPNSLRSEADCLASGYPIHKSNVFEN